MGVRLSLGAPGSDASGADHVGPRFACRRLLGCLTISAAPLLPLEPAPAQLSGPLRIVALAGAGAGLLSEPEFTGLALRGSAGLEVRLAPAAALRFEGQLGSHDGESGPHLLVAGIAVRVGRTPLS